MQTNLCYSSKFQGSFSFIERLLKEFRKKSHKQKKRKVYISVTLLCKECRSSMTLSPYSSLCVCVLLGGRFIRRSLSMVEAIGELRPTRQIRGLL